MAQITRIEIANFLTEGYGQGQQWDPLYRGVTMRVFGQSAAIQLDNGCGKTSIVDSCIFLLSQNKKLRDRVKPRMAPSDKSWTHIRIEFGMKADGEDIAQASLITAEPDEFPGANYVIGMVWNRDVDQPRFYRYQGLLEDAPCYTRPDEHTLQLVSNDAFRKSVEKMPGAKWDKWARISDWLEEVRFFTNLDVIQQNVEFQLKGGGDYSAELIKISPRNGEMFDAAFFREIVAPELLSHPIGLEGKDNDDEQRFEDGLLLSIKATTNAILDVAKRDDDLKQVSLALDRFDPVLEQASEVVVAEKSRTEELNKLTKTGGLLRLLAERDPLPGIPVVSRNASWAKEPRIMQALSHMVIDKREGVLISDEGLSKLTGIQTGEINKRSRGGVAIDSQAIELAQHLKILLPKRDDNQDAAGIYQHIDYKEHLKNKDGRGGRQYAITCYPLDAAISLLPALANLSGARTDGLSDIITRAFGIAGSEIDTNPYRKIRKSINSELISANQNFSAAEARLEIAQVAYESILTEEQETEESQIAYEGFMARQTEFPAELRMFPLKAKDWAMQADKDARKMNEDHIERAASLKDAFTHWENVVTDHAPEMITDALLRLRGDHKALTTKNEHARSALQEAKTNEQRCKKALDESTGHLKEAAAKHGEMQTLKLSESRYREIFGDADPSSINPQKEFRDASAIKIKLEKEHDAAAHSQKNIEELLPQFKQFNEIFGDVSPDGLDPVTHLRKREDEIKTEESIVNEHVLLVEALDIFNELQPNTTPDQWLADIEKQRGDLGVEKGTLDREIGEIKQELSDLDTYAVADDRIYGGAIAALKKENIPCQRLHQVVMGASVGARQKEVLALFSAMLSAPVVPDIQTAKQATQLLENNRLTVPVFVADTLKEFIRGGSIILSEDLAQHLFVGRCTKQVNILLDPSLICAEKERINVEVQAREARINKIKKTLEEIAPQSTLLRTALTALDAIIKESVRRLGEARKNVQRLNDDLPDIKRRAESMLLISAAKSFLKLGGHEMLRALCEDKLPALQTAIEDATKALLTAESRNTDEAHEARRNIQRFLDLGGEAKFVSLSATVTALTGKVSEFKRQHTEALDLATLLDEEAADAQNKLTVSLGEFALTQKVLEDAIAFDVGDNVQFMRTEQKERERLLEETSKAATRLQGIDFVRAQAYANRSDDESRSAADRKAQAESNRNQARQDKERYDKQTIQLRAKIAEISPFLELLDETIGTLLVKYRKIAELGPEIREHLLVDTEFLPEVSKIADQIRLAVSPDCPSTNPDVRSLFSNLRSYIEVMELNTKPYQSTDKELRNARKAFQEKRDDFVNRAESGEIKGLHQNEIERIRKAETTDDIANIRSLRQTIESQAQQLGQELNQYRQAVNTQKAANIEILTNLANQASTNLVILDDVMKRTPSARFHVYVDIADNNRISQIIESLIDEIEDRERHAREKSMAPLNNELERRNITYKNIIKERIYQNMFIEPKVEFCHPAIWHGERSRLVNEGPSTGQLTALMMMWIIKQADYALTRVVRLYTSRKDQKQALRKMQRILFIDGLFSNLSDEDIINGAFRGLREVSEGFQLIGFIHNPQYINNPDLFPAHLVGKKFATQSDGKRRTFVAVKPWQEANGLGFFTSAFRKNPELETDHARD
ncbi:MAG: hypothetical protein PHD65_10445 [Gallionella sp.]|nr:hypothetical protein [Gallionella sp.]